MNIHTLSQYSKPCSRYDHLPLNYLHIFPLNRCKRYLSGSVVHAQDINCKLPFGESVNNFFFFFEIKVIKGTLSETFCFTSTVYWNPWETTINYPSHDNISTIVSQSQEKSKRRPWLCLAGQNLLSSSSPLLNCNVSATVISIMAYCQTAGYFTGKRLRFGYGIWEHSLFRVYIQFSECDLSAFWLKKMHLVWRPVFFLGFTIADDTCIKRNAL